MPKSQLTTQTPITVDSNIAHNIGDLQKHYGDDSGLVRDMIIYLAYQFKYSMFGFTYLDLDDFSQVMGYSKKHLQDKHDQVKANPELERAGKVEVHYQEEGKKKIKTETHLFTSAFEYCLYQLGAKNLPISFTGKAPQNGLFGIDFVQIITSIRVVVDVTKHKQRRYYKVRLGEDFVSNMLFYFTPMSLNEYLNMPKDRLKSLYVLFSYYKHVHSYHQRELEIKMDEVTKAIDLQYGTAKRTKQELKLLLDQLTLTSLNFRYRFDHNRKQKQDYIIKFWYEGQSQEDRAVSLNREFRKKLYMGLREYYIRTYELKFPRQFHDWLSNNTADISVKAQIVHDNYYRVYKVFRTEITRTETGELLNNYLNDPQLS